MAICATPSGYYLMGWALDSTGNIPSDRNDMAAVNINALSGKANPTTTITLQGQSAVEHGDHDAATRPAT